MATTETAGSTTPATTQAVRLGVHLKRAQHLLRQRMDEQLRPLGLNAGLWSVLHEMVNSPGASSSELARSAFQTPQTVGGLVKRLTQLGLVERHQPRGRVVENHLTDRGISVYHQATDNIDALINSVLADLTATDRDRLDTLLISLVASLGVEPAAHG